MYIKHCTLAHRKWHGTWGRYNDDNADDYDNDDDIHDVHVCVPFVHAQHECVCVYLYLITKLTLFWGIFWLINIFWYNVITFNCFNVHLMIETAIDTAYILHTNVVNDTVPGYPRNHMCNSFSFFFRPWIGSNCWCLCACVIDVYRLPFAFVFTDLFEMEIIFIKAAFAPKSTKFGMCVCVSGFVLGIFSCESKEKSLNMHRRFVVHANKINSLTHSLFPSLLFIRTLFGTINFK